MFLCHAPFTLIWQELKGKLPACKILYEKGWVVRGGGGEGEGGAVREGEGYCRPSW